MKETKKVKTNWHVVDNTEREYEIEVLRWPDEKGKKYKYFMDIDICLYPCAPDISTTEDRAGTAIAAGLLILCTDAEYFEYTKFGPAGGNERFVVYSNDIAKLLSIQQYLLSVCGFGAESADDTPASIYYNGNYIEK